MHFPGRQHPAAALCSLLLRELHPASASPSAHRCRPVQGQGGPAEPGQCAARGGTRGGGVLHREGHRGRGDACCGQRWHPHCGAQQAQGRRGGGRGRRRRPCPQHARRHRRAGCRWGGQPGHSAPHVSICHADPGAAAAAADAAAPAAAPAAAAAGGALAHGGRRGAAAAAVRGAWGPRPGRHGHLGAAGLSRGISCPACQPTGLRRLRSRAAGPRPAVRGRRRGRRAAAVPGCRPGSAGHEPGGEGAKDGTAETARGGTAEAPLSPAHRRTTPR